MPQLKDLLDLGQSAWLDYISRDFVKSGDLQKMIEGGLRGMTSNPAIFEQAIAHGEAYDEQIRALAAEGKSTADIYEALAVQDIQAAADLLAPVYDSSDGTDGFVSLEVNPHLAHDEAGTIAEAKRLWDWVGRPNLMIKVPATDEGVRAVQQLIAEGININITLMFSMTHYEDVAEAYIAGLEALAANDGDLAKVASVASFFISRVDAKLDPQLPESLQGKIGVANAKNVYQKFLEIFGTARWQALAEQGARVQRPLWASTSTKNPDYSDTLYVDNLIGADTVNTLPQNTLDAFLDHGIAADTIAVGLDGVRDTLHALAEHGIDLLAVGQELQDEGVEKFNKPFDSLLESLDSKKGALMNA